MSTHCWIAILDFGSQYSQLIARRIREEKVYCELLRFDTPAAQLKERGAAGVIFSGGPASVLENGSPRCDPAILELGIPILGICYGQQMIAQLLNGSIEPGDEREYGSTAISVEHAAPLFKNFPKTGVVWMSHGDQVTTLPDAFHIMATSKTCPVAAMGNDDRRIYGLQFHPEVVHTPHGVEILKSYLFDVCRCRPDWEIGQFIAEQVESIRTRVGTDHVVCGLSGGVDSSVVAALIHKAIGDQLHCIFVDNGVLRAGEFEQVQQTFGATFGVDLHAVDAKDRFLGELAGVVDPEEKRKIIGRVFIDVFSDEARRLGDIKYLAQGTLYPDVIESISPIGGPSATIKTHHNVGGLPDDLHFELIEPVRELFKDEVRGVGRELGLPAEMIDRQPFPGPGLAVRILGEVTPERIAILQQADIRVQEEMSKLENYKQIWQSFAVLLPIQTVGVMGDSRTYEHVAALRVVDSIDAMTADWTRVPYDTLARISNRIINEVKGINRVVYDISSKPPATIEWE